MDGFDITSTGVHQLSLARDDLDVQAMIFDMDVDIETLKLVPKETYKEPSWLTNWKEKINAGDYDNRLDAEQE